MNQVVWKFIRPVFFVSNILGLFPLNRFCKLNPALLLVGLIWPLSFGYAAYKIESMSYTSDHIIFISYKIIFSHSTFLVTGCLGLAYRRELDRTLTKISKIVDDLEVYIPHSSIKSLAVLLFYPFGIYFMYQAMSPSRSPDMITTLIFIFLPPLHSVLPMLRFGAGVTLGNHCLYKLVEMAKTAKDPYRLRRLLCLHNSLAGEMFRLNLIHSFQILFFVTFLFSSTLEKLYRMQLRKFHMSTVYIVAWIIYAYFALKSFISPCVKSQEMDKSFNDEVVKFSLRSQVVNFSDIKYHFVLKNVFTYTANFCFNLDQSLILKMLENGITTMIVLKQLSGKSTPTPQDNH